MSALTYLCLNPATPHHSSVQVVAGQHNNTAYIQCPFCAYQARLQNGVNVANIDQATSFKGGSAAPVAPKGGGPAVRNLI